MDKKRCFLLLRHFIREQIESDIPSKEDFRFGPFIHFTSKEDAKKIKESGFLRKSSIVSDTVFAVKGGGFYVPEVQLTTIGRPSAGSRDYAVVFKTLKAPTGDYPEEVFWEIPGEQGITIDVVAIIPREMSVRKYLKSDVKIEETNSKIR